MCAVDGRTYATSSFAPIIDFRAKSSVVINPLSANFTKWSNTFQQFVNNCSHNYHECCVFSTLQKNMGSSGEIFDCSLWRRHVQFRDFGNNEKFQFKRVNFLNKTYYGSIVNPFGRMDSTFIWVLKRLTGCAQVF